ncbi:ribosomal protein L7/L12 [Millisia brevis]|uniref:ribosomal protein L7/L12 n=1 Tax=Millisia brevis TaxID=264148 RepID=UPI0008302DF0
MGLFGNGRSTGDIERLERRVGELERQVAQLRAAAGFGTAAAPLEEWEQQVRQLNDAGKKIEAIKSVREATGWGLREAKEYVDRI